MITNPNERLEQAIGLLGYHENQPAHYRSNLLNAIALFAGVTGDEGLVYACEARINLICAENGAAPIGTSA